MRGVLILSFLVLIVVHPAHGDPREAYERAVVAEDTLEADRVADLWSESREAARTAGDAYFLFFSGYRLALHLQHMERTRDALQTVEETLAGFAASASTREPWTSSHHARRIHLELLFLNERCLSEAGRVSEGWAALRHVSTVWRDLHGGGWKPTPDPLTTLSFEGWSSEERATAWRLITREAEYLDATGRTLEALTLLDRTAPLAAACAASADPYERSCADKLAFNRTLLLDFLGWSERALAEQKEMTVSLLRRGRDRSYWVARINYLRNLSQWEGPTAETLASAREAASHLRKRGGGRTLFDQMVVRMERDLASTVESREQLQADAHRLRAAGFIAGAQWAERDALVAEARDANPAGLDPRFAELLSAARLQGRKTSEPTLYREYAHYLIRQNRPAEAIPLLREAIRLTRAFGWTLHLPALSTALASAFLDAGRPDAAAATWVELDRLLAATPEIPLVRLMQTEVARAHYQARLGHLGTARATLEKAMKIAEKARLPDFQKSPIAEADLEGAVALGHKAARPSASGNDSNALDLQPLSIRSEGPSDMTLRARFLLTNASASPVAGMLEIDGPGIQWHPDSSAESFSIIVGGGGNSSISRPLTLAPGEQIVLGATATTGSEGEVTLTWRARGVRQSSRWSLARSGSHREDAVLNANALRRNGFFTQSITHQITRGPSTADTVPFRLRASIPLRLEYYHDGKLVGVDANGNGDFTQPGDMLPPATPSSPGDGDQEPAASLAATAPLARFTPDSGETEVEIFIFSTSSASTGSSEVTLEAEVYTEATWQTFARNILKPAAR